MAITFYQQPNATKYHASDYHLDFTFGSNQTGQANFSFIVETWINGVKVATDILFPITSGRAHFDASIYTRVFLRAYFGEDTISDNKLFTLSIKVKERYGVPPTTKATVYSQDVPFIYKGCHRGANMPVKGNTLTSKRNVTFPTVIRFPMLIGWIQNNSTTNAFQLLDGATTVSNVLTSTLASDGQIRIYNATPQLGTLTNTNKFEFENEVSGAVTVYSFDQCKEFTLMWLNEYGAYDYFTDIYNHFTNEQYELFKYEQTTGAFNGNTFERNNIKGNVSYLKNHNKGGIIVTEDLDDSEQRIIREMLRSPFIVLADSNGYKRIEIENKSWVLNQTYFEDSEPIEIAYKDIHTYQSQLL